MQSSPLTGSQAMPRWWLTLDRTVRGESLGLSSQSTNRASETSELASRSNKQVLREYVGDPRLVKIKSFTTLHLFILQIFWLINWINWWNITKFKTRNKVVLNLRVQFIHLKRLSKIELRERTGGHKWKENREAIQHSYYSTVRSTLWNRES